MKKIVSTLNPLDLTTIDTEATDSTARYRLSSADCFIKFPLLRAIYRDTQDAISRTFPTHSPSKQRQVLLCTIQAYHDLLKAENPLSDFDFKTIFSHPVAQRILHISDSAEWHPSVSLIAVINAIGYVQKMTPSKAEIYLSYLENRAAHNDLYIGHFEAYMFSRLFYERYDQIPESDAPAYVVQADLARRYFEWFEDRVQPSQIAGALPATFAMISAHIPDLVAAKRTFLLRDAYKEVREAVATAGVFNPLSDACPGFPNFSLNELSHHLLADNLSWFQHFRLPVTPPDVPHWFQMFHGFSPLVLHGVRDNFPKIKDCGRLVPGAGIPMGNTPELAGRNSQWVFYGTPGTQYSRTGFWRMFGPVRLYGGIVVEFPYRELSAEVHYTMNLRGTIFRSFKTARGTQPVFDIRDPHPIDLDRATAIFVATDDEYKQVSGWLTASGNLGKIPIVRQEAATERYQLLTRFAAAKVGQFIQSNSPLVRQMHAAHLDLASYLRQEAHRLQPDQSRMDSALVDQFINELACVHFDDFWDGPRLPNS